MYWYSDPTIINSNSSLIKTLLAEEEKSIICAEMYVMLENPFAILLRNNPEKKRFLKFVAWNVANWQITILFISYYEQAELTTLGEMKKTILLMLEGLLKFNHCLKEYKAPENCEFDAECFDNICDSIIRECMDEADVAPEREQSVFKNLIDLQDLCFNLKKPSDDYIPLGLTKRDCDSIKMTLTLTSE